MSKPLRPLLLCLAIALASASVDASTATAKTLAPSGTYAGSSVVLVQHPGDAARVTRAVSTRSAASACYVRQLQLLRCPVGLGVVSGYADYFQSESRKGHHHRLGIHVLLTGWVKDLKYLRFNVNIARRTVVNHKVQWVGFRSTSKHLRKSKIKHGYVHWSVLMGWNAPLGQYHLTVKFKLRNHVARYVYSVVVFKNAVTFFILRP